MKLIHQLKLIDQCLYEKAKIQAVQQKKNDALSKILGYGKSVDIESFEGDKCIKAISIFRELVTLYKEIYLKPADKNSCLYKGSKKFSENIIEQKIKIYNDNGTIFERLIQQEFDFNISECKEKNDIYALMSNINTLRINFYEDLNNASNIAKKPGAQKFYSDLFNPIEGSYKDADYYFSSIITTLVGGVTAIVIPKISSKISSMISLNNSKDIKNVTFDRLTSGITKEVTQKLYDYINYGIKYPSNKYFAEVDSSDNKYNLPIDNEELCYKANTLSTELSELSTQVDSQGNFMKFPEF